MSRRQKSRKAGSTGDVDLVIIRNRSESDIEGRIRKKMKKSSGLKAGARHSNGRVDLTLLKNQNRDPRLGSKKKIALVGEDVNVQPQTALTPEKELEVLESDPQLLVLLERMDNGEKLGSGLQSFVNEKLDRIEALMERLGLLDLDEEDEEIIETPMKQKTSAKTEFSDDELFSKFNNIDINDFKE